MPAVHGGYQRRGIGITNDGGFSEVENVEEYGVEG